MKIRIVFGWLFFVSSIVFCVFQLVTVHDAVQLQATPMLLQFTSALVCLLLASLAGQSGHKAANTVVSVIAFSVSLLALLGAGFMAMLEPGEMTPVKYAIFLGYGVLYGCFGLAFSLLTGRAPKPEAKTDA